MASPTYLAAVTGLQANAGQITQFLAAHGAQWVYPGVLQSQQATAGSGSQSLQSGFLCQNIATTITQTSIGRVALQIGTVGGSGTSSTIGPLTVSLYAALSNIPVGNALASTFVAEPYVFGASPWVSIPLYATGLSVAGPYCLVVTGPGTTGTHYTWAQSNQTSGAASSPDGINWSIQNYGLMYQVYDTTTSPQIQAICEDGGARLTTFAWTSGRVTGVGEYVQAQDGTCLATTRTLSYSAAGLLTGVA